FTIFEDSRNNIYVTTSQGFSKIPRSGPIRSFGRKEGLRYNRCDAVSEDDNGYIWVVNSKCMVKFEPSKETIQVFDHNAGLTAEGFRGASFLKTREGEFFIGSRKGMNYFFPGQLTNYTIPLNLSVYQADIADSSLYFNNSEQIRIGYSNNNILFRFTAIQLKGSNNIQYRFMLEGYDKDWQHGVDIREARYSKLPPGNYTFKVAASPDGVSWVNAQNQIELIVRAPVWRRWWFISASILAFVGLFIWFGRYRNRQMLKQKEELETEQAIRYFASSMAEQQDEEGILWDVARNCIGRLGFEDCVIYLLDEEKNVLIQKAAHGPKSPRQFEINQPIEIAPGQGIVGSVAKSGKAEIIGDTTKDQRYIIDDQQRMSEISVPIIYNEKILGVIDCEHSKKRFFTQKHLSILTTIASLCANKLIRARAEKEKQRAQKILMATQQKMADVEMQALRAQMNPHFIFNSLNSINRYIVKSDQVTASLYLTKFARLIRLILDNSNSKNVILAHELDALRLYIEMEALRFDKKFDYKIDVDETVNPDSVEVPPLIIQPYVENAIWHGLLHKETTGCLHIAISMPEENLLQCIIEDDGVGRQRAKALKSKSAVTRKSLGMKLTESRISLLNKFAELNASIDILDLTDGKGESIGTKVVLKIPV
ncbi:MAG TPA: histidine kinase, partial [Chitinophagaceae bacterium]|nr:histidine kinase [Chitinophagaceae bacterium]